MRGWSALAVCMQPARARPRARASAPLHRSFKVANSRDNFGVKSYAWITPPEYYQSMLTCHAVGRSVLCRLDSRDDAVGPLRK